MSRIIGIRHRRKKTREGEARPTMVAIVSGNKTVTYNLETDTDELDFLMGRYPVSHRVVDPNEVIVWHDADKNPDGIRQHHCKWRKVSRDEDLTGLNLDHMRKMANKVTEICVKVPVEFDGLKSDDSVAMVLGGSGDRFAAALSTRGEEIGAKVYRVPPFSLASNRGQADKDNDPVTLTKLLTEQPQLFYLVRRRDRDLIRVKEALALRQDAMKARIGCEQQLQQSLVGRIFLNPEGNFPEGVVNDRYEEVKTQDPVLQALIKEEARRGKDVEKAVRAVDVWERLFELIEGCGERISAGIISAIGDIRRFEGRNMSATENKLKAFCGVHVLIGGKNGDRPLEKQFPRRREGDLANWSPSVRQALYLLADQFNRRPNSVWGQKFLHYKLVLREKHPDVEEKEATVGKGATAVTKKTKRYTNGHIHKMAMWRTLTKFVEWLAREWTRVEREQQRGDENKAEAA